MDTKDFNSEQDVRLYFTWDFLVVLLSLAELTWALLSLAEFCPLIMLSFSKFTENHGPNTEAC